MFLSATVYERSVMYIVPWIIMYHNPGWEDTDWHEVMAPYGKHLQKQSMEDELYNISLAYYAALLHDKYPYPIFM